MRLLIAGLSARAMAESAARAGCDVVTADYFGDLDTKRVGPNVSLRERGLGYSAPGLARLARELRYDAVAYGGGLENHPDVVAELARGKLLLGNTPDTLQRVRDPSTLFPFLAGRGFSVPATTRRPGPDQRRLAAHGRWIVKPAAGGGGHGVRVWRGEAVRPGQILQEYVRGVSGSAVFVADRSQAALLACSEQLHTPAGFGYRGNVLPLAVDRATLEELRRLVTTLTREFGLVGLNGVDFVLRERRPVLLEVNPRFSASMELVERAMRTALFGLHLAACQDRLPTADRAFPRRGLARSPVHGKAVVYARESVLVGNVAPWLEAGWRDVPHPGDVIRRGHPICTVLASGRSRPDCLAQLRAEEVAVLARCVPSAPAARGHEGSSGRSRT
jgi:uncharacterized protein